VEFKNFSVTEIKALRESDTPGTFEAIVSVFGNVDRGGDRVKKGAFARTLKEKGLPPLIWSHNWDVPPIGVVEEATENNEGLRIKGRLFVGEGEDHPIARQVYTAMTAQDGNGQPPLREFSFGYEVRQSSEEKRDDETIRVLEDLELFEVGPTLVGMNPATRLLAAKAFEQELELAKSAVAAEETASTEDPATERQPEAQLPQDDEAQATIRRLLAERPIHLETEE
jgi:HK97 family phage prohead protease